MEWRELIAWYDCAIVVRGTAGHLLALQAIVNRVHFATVAMAGYQERCFAKGCKLTWANSDPIRSSMVIQRLPFVGLPPFS